MKQHFHLGHPSPPMLNFIKVAFLVLSLLANNVLSRNSCRQCKGEQTLIFKDYTTQNEAREYLAKTFGSCATGQQYIFSVNSTGTCLQGTSEPSCKYWNLEIMAWRYCGNGGKVDLKQANVCVGNVCTAMDNLLMKCWKSVECTGDCHCNQCGC